MNGIHRVLVPGGRFYLSVPDLDVLVWLFSRPDVNKAWRFKIMALIYGDQSNDVDFRRIGLNYDFLEDYLHDVGFSAIEHVEGFGLFDDSSELRIDGFPVSLNLVATK